MSSREPVSDIELQRVGGSESGVTYPVHTVEAEAAGETALVGAAPPELLEEMGVDPDVVFLDEDQFDFDDASEWVELLAKETEATLVVEDDDGGTPLRIGDDEEESAGDVLDPEHLEELGAGVETYESMDRRYKLGGGLTVEKPTPNDCSIDIHLDDSGGETEAEERVYAIGASVGQLPGDSSAGPEKALSIHDTDRLDGFAVADHRPGLDPENDLHAQLGIDTDAGPRAVVGEAKGVLRRREDAESTDSGADEQDGIDAQPIDSGETTSDRIDAQPIDSGETTSDRIDAQPIDAGETTSDRIDAQPIDAGETTSDRIDAQPIDDDGQIDPDRIEREITRFAASVGEAQDDLGNAASRSQYVSVGTPLLRGGVDQLNEADVEAVADGGTGDVEGVRLTRDGIEPLGEGAESPDHLDREGLGDLVGAVGGEDADGQGGQGGVELELEPGSGADKQEDEGVDGPDSVSTAHEIYVVTDNGETVKRGRGMEPGW